MTREDLADALLKEIQSGNVNQLLTILDRLNANAVDRLREAVEDWAEE